MQPSRLGLDICGEALFLSVKTIWSTTSTSLVKCIKSFYLPKNVENRPGDTINEFILINAMIFAKKILL
jgi:hypothetical protein